MMRIFCLKEGFAKRKEYKNIDLKFTPADMIKNRRFKLSGDKKIRLELERRGMQ